MQTIPWNPMKNPMKSGYIELKRPAKPVSMWIAQGPIALQLPLWRSGSTARLADLADWLICWQKECRSRWLVKVNIDLYWSILYWSIIVFSFFVMFELFCVLPSETMWGWLKLGTSKLAGSFIKAPWETYKSVDFQVVQVRTMAKTIGK